MPSKGTPKQGDDLYLWKVALFGAVAFALVAVFFPASFAMDLMVLPVTTAPFAIPGIEPFKKT